MILDQLTEAYNAGFEKGRLIASTLPKDAAKAAKDAETIAEFYALSPSQRAYHQGLRDGIFSVRSSAGRPDNLT